MEFMDGVTLILDDDVDMNEFCKRYEIISFEDGKYTIREKQLKTRMAKNEILQQAIFSFSVK